MKRHVLLIFVIFLLIPQQTSGIQIISEPDSGISFSSTVPAYNVYYEIDLQGGSILSSSSQFWYGRVYTKDGSCGPKSSYVETGYSSSYYWSANHQLDLRMKFSGFIQFANWNEPVNIYDTDTDYAYICIIYKIKFATDSGSVWSRLTTVRIYQSTVKAADEGGGIVDGGFISINPLVVFFGILVLTGFYRKKLHI